jgi:hypothetical protein
MVAVIKGIEPKDQLETMLAAHSLTMEFACRLANAGDLAWRDSAERTLNKLARTFAAQVETLKRYRTGGERKVTVQHVSISDGGQAIVGKRVSTWRRWTPCGMPAGANHRMHG